MSSPHRVRTNLFSFLFGLLLAVLITPQLCAQQHRDTVYSYWVSDTTIVIRRSPLTLSAQDTLIVLPYRFCANHKKLCFYCIRFETYKGFVLEVESNWLGKKWQPAFGIGYYFRDPDLYVGLKSALQPVSNDWEVGAEVFTHTLSYPLAYRSVYVSILRPRLYAGLNFTEEKIKPFFEPQLAVIVPSGLMHGYAGLRITSKTNSGVSTAIFTVGLSFFILVH